MDPRNVGERLERTTKLDVITEPLARAADLVLPAAPSRTASTACGLDTPSTRCRPTFPSGSGPALVLDLAGGEKTANAAEELVDSVLRRASHRRGWSRRVSELKKPERRCGTVHAVAT
jgi:hypothetical protein